MLRLAHIAWILLALGLLALAVLCESVLAFALLTAIVATPFVEWALVRRCAADVHVELHMATTAQKNAEVTCEVLVRNEARLALSRVLVELEVRNLLTGEQERRQIVCAVRGSSSATAELAFQSDVCGRIECSVECVWCYDALGLLRARVPLDEAHDALALSRRVSVMPELLNSGMRAAYAEAPLADTSIFSPYAKGNDPSEIFALREYAEGDEVRAIHWKLSSKLDQVIVRDPSLPLDNTMLLLWDNGALFDVPSSQDIKRVDAMADVMLSLCQTLAHAGMAFDVAYFDRHAGRMRRQHVCGEDDVYEAIGQLMSQPVSRMAESALEMCVRELDLRACASLIRVGLEAEPGLLSMAGCRRVVDIACDRQELVEIDGTAAQIHFDGDAPQFALSALEAV